MARCMQANQPPTATIITLGRILDAKAREEQGLKSNPASVPGSRFCDLMALSSLLQQHSQETLISFSQVFGEHSSAGCALHPDGKAPQVARAFADYMGPDAAHRVDMREVLDGPPPARSASR